MPHTIMESNSKAFHPFLNRVPSTKGSFNLNDQRIPKESKSRKWLNTKHVKHEAIPMGFYKAIQNAKVKFISTEEVCFTNHPKISFKASNSGASSCRSSYGGMLYPSSRKGVKDPYTSSSLTKPVVFKQSNTATVYSGLPAGNANTTRDAVIADKEANARNKVSVSAALGVISDDSASYTANRMGNKIKRKAIDGRENYATTSKRPAPEATNPSQILLIHPDEKLLNVPAPKVCWKGVFEVFDRATHVFDEIEAHFPCQVSYKVYDISKQIPIKLKLNLLPRRDAWPFQSDIPTCYDIGLYFFAAQFDRRSDKYFGLLEHVGSKDFVMQSRLGEVELLIYPSTQLRLDSHRIAGHPYFWGVFRRKKSRKPADIANGCRAAPQEQTSACWF
ncbi:uncharacterized protein LOC141822407 isoform X2 [Curcuma longa]|uniref:uncharacterized protein LOC141822407 isoform X2 n=1 Tax=Curcuma longa TaxID=136217 RepID=UPI003D9FA16F